MNIYLLISSKRGPRSVDITRAKVAALSIAIVSVLALTLAAGGYLIAYYHFEQQQGEGANKYQLSIMKNQQDIESLARQATDDINALAMRLGQMEARSIRLDALGNRLVSVAGLEAEEFDFVDAPAVGGPSTDTTYSSKLPDLLQRFSELQTQIDDRANKLSLLESILIDRELEKQVSPTGTPVRSGWMSSKYGPRPDPFTGKSTWHAGMDFAGKYGSDVIAVASGVVTWAGKKIGYGNMVEISHGNDLQTRYAHNSKSMVKVGETIEKGDVIAKMGSSGRSTGPHVHFEVIKDGKMVNPARYIQHSRAH